MPVNHLSLSRLSASFLAIIGGLFVQPLLAGVPVDLPYPATEPDALEVARQVFFVNHFYALKNVSIEKKKKIVTVIINKSKGKRASTNTVKRYINNDYSDGEIKAKDLAIFTSGKMRGTGILVTDYVADDKSQSYAIWLPALRKVRRFAEPAHEDSWGGTDFTFGDVTLRKPFNENHELLGKTEFPDCLHVIDIPKKQRNWHMNSLPKEPVCEHKGKSVYQLKSTTKFPNWWYDYRISYVDTKTFADYRTEYFKGDKKIKIIDRNWGNLGLPDVRGASWKFWYGKNLDTEHETMAIIPTEVFKYNTGKKESLWSERTLRKLKR